MQYIEKSKLEPAAWGNWFSVPAMPLPRRSYDYGLDYSAMTELWRAKEFLLKEQHGLCAYCQSKLTLDQSSIEHVIPKELNIELSTVYSNLVAVCKSPLADPSTGRLHCDKEKSNKLIFPLIFVSVANVNLIANNKYFTAQADGSIVPKLNLNAEDKKLVEVYIEVLNLNHSLLMAKRSKDVLNKILDVFRVIPKPQRRSFWERQFTRILGDPSQPFRQFLLIYISNQLGRH
jgi:uncharacterized protein (TIGR02646 family)